MKVLLQIVLLSLTLALVWCACDETELKTNQDSACGDSLAQCQLRISGNLLVVSAYIEKRKALFVNQGLFVMRDLLSNNTDFVSKNIADLFISLSLISNLPATEKLARCQAVARVTELIKWDEQCRASTLPSITSISLVTSGTNLIKNFFGINGSPSNTNCSDQTLADLIQTNRQLRAQLDSTLQTDIDNQSKKNNWYGQTYIAGLQGFYRDKYQDSEDEAKQLIGDKRCDTFRALNQDIPRIRGILISGLNDDCIQAQ